MAQTILVVEDDAVVSDYLKLCLMLMGYTVVAVSSRGEDAVVHARDHHPDLILMDIQLRGQMTGLEAAQAIRKENDIPVVYLTGFGDDALLQSAKITEPFGYLLKPFRENDLKNVIEIALYRHRMAKELQEREASYRILAESLPGIVYRSFSGGKSIFFNNMLEAMTGFSETELVAGEYSCLGSLLLPEDKPFVSAVLAKSISKGMPFEVEYRIRHKDGTIRHFLERGKATVTGNESSSFVDSVVLDITERKLAEEKLEQAYLKLMERQSFIESILTNIQSGIIVTDLDLKIMLMNPSAEKFLAVSASDVVGKEMSLVCPSFSEAIANNDNSAEIVCSVCEKEHTIGYKLFHMIGKDGAVTGHIISFADLTEIVKIRTVMKSKERLAAMGEFVARVAHEIRNPLFGMTAICQIFSMELELGDSHKKLMESMMNEAWRLKQLVEELLDCSRELKLVKRPCNLVKIVEESLFENKVLLKDKEVAVETKYSEDAINVTVDPDKIKQVILNLVKNAVEASFKKAAIQISVEKADQLVILRVSDQGAGIPDHLIDKVFDVFYTTKRHGTGLGLAISKNIAVAHGGALQAHNRLEGGSSFVFSLPLSA